MADALTDLHQTARDFAEAGIPPFPCVEGGKAPACANGFKDAACDVAQIDQWWTANPNYNVAIEPDRAGWCVVDIDGAEGEASWAKLLSEHGAPDTYEVRTPRGGRHLYFAGSLPATASKIGAKIDTRGVGSYVLIAPSVVNGKPYEVSEDRDMAPLPAWIAELATARSERATAAANVELDSAANIDRAVAFLKAQPPAIEGHGGDAHTFATAAAVRDLGVSEESAGRLLADHWNDRCVPPWQADELETKISNAYAYGQNEAGAYAAPPAQEIFGSTIAALTAATPAPSAGRGVVLRDEGMQDSRPPPRYLIDGLLPEVGTVGWHAPFNSYKSFLATDTALAAASGRPAFGKFAVHRQGSVIAMLGEGLSGLETLRRPAWRIARSIPEGERIPIYTTEGVPPVRSAEDVGAYFAAVDTLAKPPVLIVIDTLSRAMAGLNENDAGDAGRYLEMVEAMAKRYRCCVLTIMHEGKVEDRGARGSSAFAAGFDAVWRIEADTNTLTAKLVPVKLKDDAGIEPIHLKGRAVPVPGTKGSLVFDWVAPDDYKRAAGKAGGIQRGDVGKALQELGAVRGETVPTRVLAASLAGPGAGVNLISAAEKNLRRGAHDRFAAYVAHHGQGRGDATLWAMPTLDIEEGGR
ncbi:MAG TPA: bifunctional DNA primase/polymerase [Rhizomicrobium sp.]